MDLSPIWITLKLATVTTVILMVIATPLAWWLVSSRSRFKPLLEAIVSLPLVLPPTVLGFYLLVFLGRDGALGHFWFELTGAPLAFTFTGLVIGSVLYSMPFAVQPLQTAFQSIGKAPLEAAASLRANAWDRFFSIVAPLSRKGFLTAITLSFAHTVGEFGVVLMIGGNIPGQTQVISIAIYDHVEAMEFGIAHTYSIGLLIFSFVVLALVAMTQNRGQHP